MDLFKTIVIILFLSFIAMYITTKTNYQQIENKNKNILTEEAIKRFEKDVKEGKKIVASNYLSKEKNYDNKISSLGLKISNIIENTYKKTINKIFKKLSNLVEE